MSVASCMWVMELCIVTMATMHKLVFDNNDGILINFEGICS